jgi:elongation factor G
MKREYNCIVVAGQPQVAYRETITQRADFNYTHKKQTGGSGQYGRVSGWLEPTAPGEADFEFTNKIRGGAIPIEFLPAVEKGFKGCMEKGRLIGFPVIGVHVFIDDGQAHAVDSSEIAFVAAARGAFREGFAKAKPVALEPIMKLEVQGPSEFLGAMTKTVMQRRGQIQMTSDEGDFSTIEAEVPLAEMFGYATDLRSTTQGKAEFSMEFSRYLPAPNEVQKALKEKYGTRVKDEE